MKHHIVILISIVLTAFTCTLFAQAPAWIWAYSAGGSGADVASGGTDSNGNTYLFGQFDGTITLGTTTLSGNGAQTMFIAKIDPQGNWLWAMKTGGYDDQWADNCAVDDAGNIYISGGFDGTVVFGDNSYSVTSDEDIFVAKIDTNGNWLWSRKAGGQGSEFASGLAIGNDGAVYLSGEYDDDLVLGQVTLPNSEHDDDIFIAKLDINGDWLWARNGGSIGDDYGSLLAVDNVGNAYVTGVFSGTAVFGDHTVTNDTGDANFVVKVDTNGNYIWAKQLAGESGEVSRLPVTTDATGSVFVVGSFSGNAIIGSTTLISNGDTDLYIARLDPLGNVVWVEQAGGIGNDGGLGICIDISGDILVTGGFSFVTTFGATTLTSHGGMDVFLVELNPSGNWLWAKNAGGLGDDAGISVGVDNLGNSIVIGVFEGTIMFGNYGLGSEGDMDIFVAKSSCSSSDVIDLGVVGVPILAISNNPNPFNVVTTVSFLLPKTTKTEICIFNIRGQLVRRLMNESKAAGQHTISWDGRDDHGNTLASGMYLCKISAAGIHEAHKMLLLR